MLVLLNTVGLTTRLLEHAPRLSALARAGWQRPLCEVLPAVTCTAQATFLTGKDAQGHGIVGNGWLWRDTMEVRFWQQSNRLIEAEPLYHTARRLWRGPKPFRCAKLFWWFNQGAGVDFYVTPKPWYGADGNKVFGILGKPEGLTERLEQQLGQFPFFTFWGPSAGLPCTEWIGRCAAAILREEQPDLTLVYLPHLDYDTQRLGPSKCDLPRLVRELDAACAPVLDAAQSVGAQVWVVNEYTHVEVHQPILLNRRLREAKLLAVRDGPFGETIDFFESRAFAVCDHQMAHVYVRDAEDRPRVRDLLARVSGVARALEGDARSEIGLNHPRAGDFVVLATPEAWFAYPYWLDDRRAPDFARTVDIHRKPGYDPCELYFDPGRRWPRALALLRLVQKKLGFRSLFDVVPLDPSLVRGSHGLSVTNPADRPIVLGHGPAPSSAEVPQVAVRDLVLKALGVAHEC
jgi:predicted AlkP superfamily pyrophosphatase or phosphodiesterase